jgi:hypothetical protein
MFQTKKRDLRELFRRCRESAVAAVGEHYELILAPVDFPHFCAVFVKFEIGLSAVNRSGAFLLPRTSRHVADAHSLRRPESEEIQHAVKFNDNNVPTEMRENYVKKRDGKYQL